ncbi:hypothetical protein PCANC_16231 [Puccinia coronata f. sp. avenae]|uniref:Uncharacterized protein n=1 Tax=Puccinia coronata f. sp. avenae TaxID=200324 RepID=A0A2N5TUM6_9BASI|nr:hypothetical protein PCASD_14625 [Puccinia coronata f. sp. avenae]PLW31574.1 hypothetical protein PCANC_16231 [Puccinia coronata f. sp. avenae]
MPKLLRLSYVTRYQYRTPPVHLAIPVTAPLETALGRLKICFRPSQARAHAPKVSPACAVPANHPKGIPPSHRRDTKSPCAGYQLQLVMGKYCPGNAAKRRPWFKQGPSQNTVADLGTEPCASKYRP